MRAHLLNAKMERLVQSKVTSVFPVIVRQTTWVISAKVRTDIYFGIILYIYKYKMV